MLFNHQGPLKKKTTNQPSTVSIDDFTKGIFKPNDSIECPILDTKSKHVQLENHSRLLGNVVTYQCLPGYTFKDRTTFRTTECIGKGIWSTEVEACLGKYIC